MHSIALALSVAVFIASAFASHSSEQNNYMDSFNEHPSGSSSDNHHYYSSNDHHERDYNDNGPENWRHYYPRGRRYAGEGGNGGRGGNGGNGGQGGNGGGGGGKGGSGGSGGKGGKPNGQDGKGGKGGKNGITTRSKTPAKAAPGKNGVNGPSGKKGADSNNGGNAQNGGNGASGQADHLPPSYSAEPANDEQTLQRNGSGQTPQLPTGIYTQTSGNLTVKLFQQREGASIPTYGRQGIVNGLLQIKNPKSTILIVMKVDGKLDTLTSTGGTTTVLLNRSYTLWRKNNATNNQLLDAVEISYVLPTTFLYRGAKNHLHQLPPSFRVEENGSIFFVRSYYSITISVSRALHRSVGFLTTTDEPRSRANRPILSTPAFYSTLKTCPEEWHQAISGFQSKSAKDQSQIQLNAHLFIPVSRVYALSDTIPFHIQLTGPLDTLQRFITRRQQRGPTATLPSSSSSTYTEGHSNVEIKITIRRSVQIESQVQDHHTSSSSSKDHIIADGEVWEVPPSLCEVGVGAHLDWQGKLRLREDCEVGSFQAGNVNIKDTVDITVNPRVTEGRRGFLPLKLSVPIRIVEDPHPDTIPSYERNPDYLTGQ
ncbi:hypothetical protein H0H93_013304 [Arthromyces matolae]|nr:hypothetical protein H0H93_013304 [Arthromyces matolae]